MNKSVPLLHLTFRLWRHLNSRRQQQLALLLAIMIMASISEVVSIGLVLPFLGALMSPERMFAHHMLQPAIKLLNLTEAKQLLLPLTLLFIFAALFSSATRLMLLWCQTRLGHGIGADFSYKIYKNTLYQPYYVHIARSSSRVVSAITGKITDVVQNSLLPILMIISSGLILIFVMGALIAIDPLVALAAFGGFSVIYGLIIVGTKNRIAHNSQRINRESDQVIKTLQEGLGGIRDILVDGAQATFCEIYQKADYQLRRSIANINIISWSPRFLVESLGMILIGIIAYLLADRKQGIATAIPVLGALALGAQRMLPLLQQIYSGFSGMRGSRSSLQDVMTLLDQPVAEKAKVQQPIAITFKKSIQLNKVGFRYQERESWALRDINVKIEKGSQIGFIGTTGSGKSTLLDIVMGLLNPTEGTLTVDGVPITVENHRSWQAHIAHVPQAIFLADSTIAANIAFGIPPEKIDVERVRHAAEQAQIAETIETWSKGYNTIVGERGIQLSGGQRQRIGIARALYKKAEVIILDEATSALDTKTENDIMQSINKLNKSLTIIIVAHRISTLQNCSKIVELENGQIIKIADYIEILEELKN